MISGVCLSLRGMRTVKSIYIGVFQGRAIPGEISVLEMVR
jgi:hypothetical protein